MLDVADHPCLRDAGLARVARNAAGGALVLVEAAIDLAAIALGGAHGRPVAFGVVGHEAGADDADAVAVGVAARRLQRRAPRIEHHRARALRQEVAVIACRALRAGLRHRGDPERRAALLHVARPDHHVVEIVALAMETELLAGEAMAQHLDAFVGQRHAARDGQTEAAELVRRVAHADADLDAAVADIVEHREVLGQPHRMVERQQADVARHPHAFGTRGDRARHRHPRRQVAVVEEVVLGEPDEIESEPVEHHDLVHDRGVQARHVHARFRRVAKIVDGADAKGWTHDACSPLVRMFAALSSAARPWPSPRWPRAGAIAR